MVHKFGVHNKHKLDNERRRSVLPPYETLLSLGLQKGDFVADVGSGIGYFTLPAAEIVGESGMVFALDISPEMINELEGKLEAGKTTNVKTVITQENELKVDSGLISYAFICNVLHETEDMKVFLQEVWRILKDTGKIVIVEWKKEETDYGPPLNHRLALEDVSDLVVNMGFRNVKHQEIGQYFYAVTAEK